MTEVVLVAAWVSTLVSALVTLLMEYLFEPYLDARSERIREEQRLLRALRRSLRPLVGSLLMLRLAFEFWSAPWRPDVEQRLHNAGAQLADVRRRGLAVLDVLPRDLAAGEALGVSRAGAAIELGREAVAAEVENGLAIDRAADEFRRAHALLSVVSRWLWTPQLRVIRRRRLQREAQRRFDKAADEVRV